MTPAASLADALLLEPAGVIAFVGAGGKTTAILRLARELVAAGVRTIATTTTRVGDSMSAALPFVDAGADEVYSRLDGALAERGCVFLAGEKGEDGKFQGPSPHLLNRMAADRPHDIILVEADGSRGKSLKAPAGHEPVIPESAGLVVPVAGLDAIGRRVDEASVHRPSLVSRMHAGDLVTPALIAAVVTSDRGGLKNVPAAATVRPLLTKAGRAHGSDALAAAESILALADGRIERVVISDVATPEFAFLERDKSGKS